MKIEKIHELLKDEYITFVCGFMFDNEYKNVALIRKNRPDWQKGFLNGIGGKVEFDERPYDALVREFKEETGHETIASDWKLFADIMQDDKWFVWFYYATGDLSKLRTTESEEVVILPVKDLFESNALPSVKWLVPLCFDKTHHYTSSLYNKVE